MNKKIVCTAVLSVYRSLKINLVIGAGYGLYLHLINWLLSADLPFFGYGYDET